MHTHEHACMHTTMHTHIQNMHTCTQTHTCTHTHVNTKSRSLSLSWNNGVRAWWELTPSLPPVPHPATMQGDPGVRGQVRMPRGPGLTTRSSQERGQGGPQGLYSAPSVELQSVTVGGGGGAESRVGCPPQPLSPKSLLQLSCLCSLPPAPIPDRYLGTTRPGRPPPGPEVPRSNPPGPGVGAGRRLESGSEGLPHSSGCSWTREPKDPSPQLLRGQQRKECGEGAWLGLRGGRYRQRVSPGVSSRERGTHGHTPAGSKAPPRPRGLGREQRARLRGAAAPRWTAPRWGARGAKHRSGADGAGRGRRRPSTRSTGSKETTWADLRVHRTGRERAERGPPSPILGLSFPSTRRAHFGGGGSGVGRFLTLLTGPGRAVGDDPRHTGAGGRAAEGRGVLTSCVVPPGFMLKAQPPERDLVWTRGLHGDHHVKTRASGRP